MFDSGLYWAAVALLAIVTRILPGDWVRARAGVVALTSTALLLGPLGVRPWILAAVALLIGWVVLGVRLTAGLAKRSTMAASLAVFAPMLSLWVVGKAAVAGVGGTLRFLYFIGLSYLLVKSWTFIKDVHDGRIKAPSPVVVAAYFLFAPTYVSGPMHLYGEFEAAMKSPTRPGLHAMVDAVFRVAIGFVKIRILVPLLSPASLLGLHGNAAGFAQMALAAMVYSVVLWADFSGYCDIAIGSARVMGVETPENFKWPYLAPNIREFWQRWHITFSRVLTSYVFVPVARSLQGRLPSSPRLVAICAYLVTFSFCGYWHGATLNFLLWGLYHGVGMIAYDLFKADARKVRALSPTRRRVRNWVMAAATFVFVSQGWILFVLPVSAFVGDGR